MRLEYRGRELFRDVIVKAYFCQGHKKQNDQRTVGNLQIEDWPQAIKETWEKQSQNTKDDTKNEGEGADYRKTCCYPAYS